MEHEMTTSDRRGDAGFTLVETMIAVFVGMIIAGAIGFGLTTYAQATGSTSRRVLKSRDANVAATFIIKDAVNMIFPAASGTGISTSDTASCPDTSYRSGKMVWPAQLTAVVRFTWSATTSTST